MVRSSHRLGIDANRPIVVGGPHTGAPSPTVADPGIIAATGAGWARVNFVLGPWANPSDKTPHQGRTWEQVYHEILSGLRAKGLSIYALIGSEAVQVDPGNLLRDAPEDTAPDIAARARSWVEQYVANFCAIARQFREQVQVFESFNEPDDWHGGGRAWVHPAWFAIMLQAIHQAARAAPDLRDLTLVSGPLQGLEINRNEAPKAYLRDTYAQGKRRFGWGQTVPFPFDGVGYHLYIKEGWEADWPKQEQAVRAAYRAYVDGIRAVIREAEGRDKPLCLSEFGWLSNRGLEDFQAENLRVGLNLALEDPAVDLAIWFCTQDFGEEHDNKYYGLYRKGNLTPDNRKPAYYAFKALCQSALPIGTAPFTNQTMINAVFAAAKELDVPPWNLLVKAGLSDLVHDREAPYTGPDVDGLTNLTEAERAAIRRKLSELAPAVRYPTGHVVAETGLYAAPSAEAAPLVALPPDALVEILAGQGEWLHVAALGRTGYVRKSAVRRADQRVAAGFLRARSELQSIAMAAPASQAIPPEAAAGNPTVQALAETWNRYGGLLAVLASELKIDPALAAAVLVAESRGRGFGPDGRMIIRFENHVFYRRWGREHAERHAQHFRFDPQEAWKGHVWRPSPDGAWRPFHGDQSAEWEVFQFACALDDTAAKLSISMGAPQIMGFNHAGIGYDSVQGMYDAFSGDERYQILGFFDFAKGPTGESEALRALQDCDLETFAAKYNGAGEAARYAGLIAERLQMLRQLRAGEAIPFGAALPTFAPMEAMEVGEAVPQAIPEELSYLPAPALGEGELHLLRADPELYGYWREHIRHGFERNDQMFRRILEGFMRPYNTTIWMYRILFGLGVLCFLAAAGLGAWTGNAVTTLVFGGLGVAAFLSYFISRPIQSLEQNLKFVTWLGILYNTYWTRLLYAMDQRTVQADLQRATQDAIADIVRLLDKHAALSAKRPRVR